MRTTMQIWPVLVLCVSSAWSQNQPEVSLQEAPVTFTSRLNLVSVPVVVRDREGRPIGDLKRENFQLFDKGKLQIITKFSIEKSKSTATVTSLPGGAIGTAVETKPTLPDRYIAYLFDDVHLNRANLLQSRLAVNHHLDEALDRSSRAAIFTTSGHVLSDFTNDREKLRKAVNSVQPWSSGNDPNDCPPLTYSIADRLANKFFYTMLSPAQLMALMSKGEADPALNATYSATAACTHFDKAPLIVDWMKAAIQRVLAHGDQETSFSLGAVKDVIRRLSTMPGERNLVLVSPGFLVTLDHRLAENDIFESAVRANTVVNTIDVRGVYTLMPPASNEEFPIDDPEAADILAELAYGTGGAFFHDDNGLKEGLDQLAARPEYIYVLGFSPEDLKFDGSYHKLKVTVKNTANVSLQVRRGYWAPSRAVDASEAAKEDLEEAVFSRDEIQEIPVTLDTEFFKSTEDHAELTVTARIKPEGLRFRKAEERSNDTVTVVTGLFDANGNYISGIERVITLHLRDETLASLERAGIATKENFNVAPGRYVVRLVVRDAEGHTLSARNGGIEVP